MKNDKVTINIKQVNKIAPNRREPQVNESDDKSNLEDWKCRYDCVLTALSQEYQIQIESIRQADEKTNKYLVVMSIFIAGFFIILGSPLMDNLVFQTNLPILKNHLSNMLVILLVLAGLSSVTTIILLSRCLNFIISYKLEDLEQKLEDPAIRNSVEFKSYLIHQYQQAINKSMKELKGKQSKIKNAAIWVLVSIIMISFTISLLLVIKYTN